jgi:hypothetical protein
MADNPRPASADALATRLRSAQRRLAAPDLPPEARARLQRQFIAVCNAAKTPGTGGAACQRRLENFLAALEDVIAQSSGYKNEKS